MKIKILDASTLGPDTLFDKLSELGDVIVYDQTPNTTLKERISDADVIIINKVKITEDVISSAKCLKLICVFATGYDNVDVRAARQYGVGVCNVPGYSTDSVTLFTVATVLSLAAHLREYSDSVSSGLYTSCGKANIITPVFHEISGKTWGIVGYGNIGRAVARVAEALGARVIANKRIPLVEVECVDIDTLVAESDIITVHCPLNEETRNLINRQRIDRMKNGVILVNEARGAVLDERAVTDAVMEERIGGFGCDVYSEEPFSSEHPYNEIKNRSNVILTPHAAWSAYEARVRCVNTIARNIRSSLLENGTLNRVDKK